MLVCNSRHKEDAGDNSQEEGRANKAYRGLWRAQYVQLLNPILKVLWIIRVGSILTPVQLLRTNLILRAILPRDTVIDDLITHLIGR